MGYPWIVSVNYWFSNPSTHSIYDDLGGHFKRLIAFLFNYFVKYDSGHDTLKDTAYRAEYSEQLDFSLQLQSKV